MIEQHLDPPQPLVDLTVDGEVVRTAAGSTILHALRRAGLPQPTLCQLDNLTPVNTCRVCVVEVAGSRTLVPACSRVVEPGMEITTDNERVRHSRRLVFELLASSVDLSLVDLSTVAWMDRYGVNPSRFGPATSPRARSAAHPGHHGPPDPSAAATVAQPVKVQDELYVRDYAKCILCYKCVEACGEDAQNSFAIQVAGRGFDAVISTEFDVELPESACVYCGNCIGVCPTGALMFKTEFDLRASKEWDEGAQTVTTTICPYCGVGCNLELHVQDNRIVKVTSPLDHSVTDGHLCIKGRFGWQHVHSGT
jgi:predicted molibdopterin-dependent oxidoreductase YjgC